MNTPFSAVSVSSMLRVEGADALSDSSGPSSTSARVKCRSWYLGSTSLAPARYAARAISRARGACSTSPLITTSCPGCTLAHTEIVSSARRIRRSASSGGEDGGGILLLLMRDQLCCELEQRGCFRFRWGTWGACDLVRKPAPSTSHYQPLPLA